MLSIVIPTYNEEKYLPLLLRSIEAQDFSDYEIIVADAHSTDTTRQIAVATGARVVDGGMPGPGRNRGAEVATGEVILFLDADVVLSDPSFLRATVDEFTRRKLGIATCKMSALSDKKIDKVFHEAFNYFMWVTSAVVPHAPGFCIFVEAEVHRAIGGFDETIQFAEDHDYAMRASKVKKFGLLKTSRIPVSVRRFDRDGRFTIAIKYLFSELYMRTKGGIRSDVLKYRFGHDDNGTVSSIKKKSYGKNTSRKNE